MLIKLATVFFCTVISIPLQAQYTVGRLEGTIFDTSGAVVAGAKVTLRNVDTDTTLICVTGLDGFYVFFALPAGDYEIAAEAPRLAKKSARVRILTGETTTRPAYRRPCWLAHAV